MSDTAPRQVWRFPPCPAYDIEGTESWLTSMAEHGLHLSKDGFFLGFALFDRGEPRSVRYRMEAAKRRTSFWTEDQNAPEDEVLELNEHCGWEYVTCRDQYHLYRCADPAARELHTDPVVQAMALKQVQRRQWGELLWLVFWLLLYPALLLKTGLLTFLLDFGSWRFLWFLALVLCGLQATIGTLCYLRDLRGRLKLGQTPDHRKDWRRHLRRFRANTVVTILITAGFMVVLLTRWSGDVTRENRVPLDQYHGTVPFPTFADLDPEGSYVSDGVRNYSNDLEVTSDWLAPVMFRYSESGRIIHPGKPVLSGGLNIRYYELRSQELARWLYRDLLWEAERGRDYAPLELSGLPVSQYHAYQDIFPTLLMQEGSRVLQVQFYQTGDRELPLEDWTAVFADFLGGVS